MKTEKESLSFGRYLQAARLAKDISLDRISAQTRIGVGNLLLIEQEDHERLPAAVYVRGFLRSYAAAVGADGAEVIRRYELQLEALRTTSEIEPGGRVPVFHIRPKVLVSVVLIVGVLGLSVLAVLSLRPSPKANKNLELKHKSVEDLQKDRPSIESQTQSEEAIPEKSTLRVIAIGDLWLKAIVDGKESTEYNLKSGDQIELEADSGFNLLIGDAGAVIITLNGDPVIVPGRSGDVVTVHLP